jgi:hypothetical protein
MRREGLRRLRVGHRDERLPEYVQHNVFERLVHLLDDETDSGVRAELYAGVMLLSESAVCRVPMRAAGVVKALERSMGAESKPVLQDRCRGCLKLWS